MLETAVITDGGVVVARESPRGHRHRDPRSVDRRDDGRSRCRARAPRWSAANATAAPTRGSPTPTSYRREPCCISASTRAPPMSGPRHRARCRRRPTCWRGNTCTSHTTAPTCACSSSPRATRRSGRVRRSCTATAGSTFRCRRRTARWCRPGSTPAVCTRSPTCAAGPKKAKRGTATACARTSRTCSKTSSPRRGT